MEREQLRFVADESFPGPATRALRETGYVVDMIAEIARGADDNVVLAIAARQHSILLTEDKDFGQLVFAQANPSVGVLLVRYPASARSVLPMAVLRLVHEMGDLLRGSFVVMQPGRIRIHRNPGT